VDDAITSALNDALLAAPASYRAELCAWVQARAAQEPAITVARLDRLVMLGRVHLGVDDGNSKQRRTARRLVRDLGAPA
jgi:hypothetical protein